MPSWCESPCRKNSLCGHVGGRNHFRAPQPPFRIGPAPRKTLRFAGAGSSRRSVFGDEIPTSGKADRFRRDLPPSRFESGFIGRDRIYHRLSPRSEADRACSANGLFPAAPEDGMSAHRKQPNRVEIPIRNLERVAGIEPASQAWKASALPLSYTRSPSAIRELVAWRDGCNIGQHVDAGRPEQRPVGMARVLPCRGSRWRRVERRSLSGNHRGPAVTERCEADIVIPKRKLAVPAPLPDCSPPR